MTSSSAMASCHDLYLKLSDQAKYLESQKGSSIIFQFQSREFNPNNVVHRFSDQLKASGIKDVKISNFRPKSIAEIDLFGFVTAYKEPNRISKLNETPYYQIEIKAKNKQELFKLAQIYDDLGVKAQEVLVDRKALDSPLSWIMQAESIINKRGYEAIFTVSFKSQKYSAERVGFEFRDELSNHMPFIVAKSYLENKDAQLISHISFSIRNKEQLSIMNDLIKEFGYQPYSIQVEKAPLVKLKLNDEALRSIAKQYMEDVRSGLIDYLDEFVDYLLIVFKNEEFQRNPKGYIQFLRIENKEQSFVQLEAISFIDKVVKSGEVESIVQSQLALRWSAVAREKLANNKLIPVKLAFKERQPSVLISKINEMIRNLRDKLGVEKVRELSGSQFEGSFIFDISNEEQLFFLEQIEKEYKIKITLMEMK